MSELGTPSYNPDDWRIFIDSFKKYIKCALLHNFNLYGSIPIGHSPTAKENYEAVKKVPELVHYDDHKWIICVDLKMVNFLLGPQSGYTRFPCFLFLWDSRATDKRCVQREWPKRDVLEVIWLNIINQLLVDHHKIVFPPLHIKLGFMKQFVKVLNKENDCFKYLRESFPVLSEKKTEGWHI